ncbi:MAG: carbohydrate ABC transporter permease, partial [Clostridiales bacterium]|nr:carbohydrate ABC transporter permease [Clostridiales bacterium]
MVRDITLGSRIADKVIITILIMSAFICILPIWYTLCVSLSEKSAVAAGMVKLWPVGFNFNSYHQIIGEKKFFNSFWISIKRVVLAGGLNFIIVVLMAYPLSKEKKEFPLRNIFMWILVFSMLFNGGLIPWYITVKNYKLINTIWALVLAGGLPIFNVILVINY